MTTRTILVLHIMKTAGTSLRRMLVDSLGRPAVYPNDRDLKELPKRWYPGPRTLVDHVAEQRHHGARVLIGHLPYVVADELTPRPRTVALLRDPISRAVSMLEHRRRSSPQHQGASLAQLLDDEDLVERQIRDYQTKTFAFDSIAECPDHVNLPLEIDDERFARAVRRVEALDVVGVVERMTTFAAHLDAATGIRLGEQRSDNTGGYEGARLSDEVAERLRELTARDAVLYELVLDRIAGQPAVPARRPGT